MVPVQEDGAEHLLPKKDECVNMFSKSWFPLLYMALFLFMTLAAQTVFIPNVACAALNGGIDPCLQGGSDSDACAGVLQVVTAAQSTMMSTGTFLVFFTSPLVGAVSDVIGRKPVLIFLICPIAGSWVLLAAVKADYVSVYCLYVFGVFSTAASFLLNLMLTIVIADRLPSEHLEVGLGALFAMMGIGPISATLFTSMLSDATCIVLFLIMAIFALVAALVQPETLPRTQKKALSNMQSIRHTLRDALSLALDPRFFKMSCLILFGYITPTGIGTVWPLAYKAIYGLTMQGSSLTLLITSLSGAFMNLFLLKPIRDRVRNKGVLLVASLASIVSLIAGGWSPSVRVLLVAQIVNGMYNIFPPTTTAIMFKLAPPHLHGQAQGTGYSLFSLASIVGPIVYGSVFAFFEQPRFWFTGTFPQAPYAVGTAAWCIVSLIVLSMPETALGDAE